MNLDIVLQTKPNKWLLLTRAELVDCDQVIVWLVVSQSTFHPVLKSATSVTQFSLELNIYCRFCIVLSV